MHYKFDLINLKPGDILLSHGDGIQAKIIGEATDGNFSHAMLYVGGTVIHADGNGVYSRNPQRIYSNNKSDLAVYRLKNNLSDDEVEKICKAARSEVGKLYDIKGAISSVMSGKDRSIKNRQFCSKLVALAFDVVNINFGKSIDKITPNDFCRSDLLNLKENLIVAMDDDEYAYATSPDYNLDLQIETFEWLSEARDCSKKRNRIIGSVNDVLQYLVDFPEDDGKFCEIIERSRYYGFSGIDRENNPHRYDFLLFKERLSHMDRASQKKFIMIETIGLGEEITIRQNNYLWAVRLMAERKISFFRKDFAKELYINATTRAQVINLCAKYEKFLLKLLQ